MYVVRERKLCRMAIIFNPYMTEYAAKYDIGIISKVFLFDCRCLWDLGKVAKPPNAFRPMNTVLFKRQVAEFWKFCPRMHNAYTISQYPNKLYIWK